LPSWGFGSFRSKTLPKSPQPGCSRDTVLKMIRKAKSGQRTPAQHHWFCGHSGYRLIQTLHILDLHDHGRPGCLVSTNRLVNQPNEIALDRVFLFVTFFPSSITRRSMRSTSGSRFPSSGMLHCSGIIGVSLFQVLTPQHPTGTDHLQDNVADHRLFRSHRRLLVEWGPSVTLVRFWDESLSLPIWWISVLRCLMKRGFGRFEHGALWSNRVLQNLHHRSRGRSLHRYCDPVARPSEISEAHRYGSPGRYAVGHAEIDLKIAGISRCVAEVQNLG